MQVNGEALRAIRERDGYTVSDLATIAEIERSHLSNVEAGRRGLHPAKVRKLAHILGVPFSVLTNGVKDEEVA